ncbi:MAG: phosphatase domain-containing protein [Deltaproteobacteria bacterium]
MSRPPAEPDAPAAPVELDERVLAPALRWTRAFRWDLDKTYLETEFDGVGNLLRTALQRASQKRSVAGAPALMRELRAAGPHRVCIVSGSPRQMRRVLEEKLRLDGVEWDEFALKPNLSNLMRGRFRAMRSQVGYKLPLLLDGRSRVPADCEEILFGDDAEADAYIYSLFGDLLAGRVEEATLERILDASDVYPDQRAQTLELAKKAARGDVVRRIFIHLERRSPPVRFTPYGRRVVPIYNYFQAALVLFADGILPAPSVLKVAAEMVTGYGYGLHSLSNSFQDILRRGYAEVGVLTGLADAVTQYASLFDVFRPAKDIIEAFTQRLGAFAESRPVPPPPPAEIDYLALLDDARRR